MEQGLIEGGDGAILERIDDPAKWKESQDQNIFSIKVELIISQFQFIYAKGFAPSLNVYVLVLLKYGDGDNDYRLKTNKKPFENTNLQVQPFERTLSSTN